jgi:6-phosphogluconolactonase (cycloisomerase 2 family)
MAPGVALYNAACFWESKRNRSLEGEAMRGFRALLVLCLIHGVFALLPAKLHAQQYIFTNDNVYDGNGKTLNSTTALSVSTSGKIKVLHTYSTGSVSAGGGYFAQTAVAYTETKTNNCLFVSNGGDSTISAFTIDLSNGKLKAVKGSPFSYGESGRQQYGIGLVTGGGTLLFAGNTAYDSISVLKISPACALKAVKTYSVTGSPDGMKVTPNGKFLVSAYLGEVDSFKINYTTGHLKELGPFTAQGAAAGVEVSCDGSTVYFGDAASNTQVEVFSLSATGVLAEINNFTTNNGVNSNNVILSPDETKLYVSNTMSNQITTLSTSSGGGLAYDSSVTLSGTLEWPLGLAFGKSGNRLLVSETNSPETIGVLKAQGDGLAEIPGSPFSVIENGEDPPSLIAVPAKACKK